MEKKLKILVVDDSATNVMLLEGLLKEEGYQVVSATNGKDAYILVMKGEFDLILLDLMMPRIDGFKLLQKIKRVESKKHIPILIVSAKTDEESINKAHNLGAAGFITKPLKFSNLINKIDFIFEQNLLTEQ